MRIIETNIKDCLVIYDNYYEDYRGYFKEVFNEKRFYDLTGITFKVVQENESYSIKNVLRGLHFQTGEYTQAKLVRVTKGSVYDVCVDLREGSPTYGQHHMIGLDENDHRQFFIPRGCAHGFVVLSGDAIFNYKVDNSYNKDSEQGIIYDDPTIGINWMVDQPIVSEKDMELPNFKDFEEKFGYSNIFGYL